MPGYGSLERSVSLGGFSEKSAMKVEDAALPRSMDDEYDTVS